MQAAELQGVGGLPGPCHTYHECALLDPELVPKVSLEASDVVPGQRGVLAVRTVHVLVPQDQMLHGKTADESSNQHTTAKYTKTSCNSNDNDNDKAACVDRTVRTVVRGWIETSFGSSFFSM